MSFYADYGDGAEDINDEPYKGGLFSLTKDNGGYLHKEKKKIPGSERASEFFDKYDLFGEEVP